ncbi:hypothetical protein RND71_038647 [Anisodus tanguticus]|uniref:Uncharacterized protein n=1 Tax=Anisodus tanguticus TaxID=243964 RepID=A0AAE1R0H7_9SOLA|nr:hypothetical protein RND71_038647 [Anisodus tanguticus]
MGENDLENKYILFLRETSGQNTMRVIHSNKNAVRAIHSNKNVERLESCWRRFSAANHEYGCASRSFKFCVSKHVLKRLLYELS